MTIEGWPQALKTMKHVMCHCNHHANDDRRSASGPKMKMKSVIFDCNDQANDDRRRASDPQTKIKM